MQETLSTKFVTPEIICSYPKLFTAEDKFNSGTEKYSLSIPIKKEDKESLARIQQCVVNAAVNKWGEKARGLQGLKLPMTDSTGSSRADDPVYKDTFYFSAKSTRRPGVVGPDMQPIIDQEDIYPGCIVRASMNFYGYDWSGKKGVAVGLSNVMKVRDGDKIGGGSNAQDDFAEFAYTPASQTNAPVAPPLPAVDIFSGGAEDTPF